MPFLCLCDCMLVHNTTQHTVTTAGAAISSQLNFPPIFCFLPVCPLAHAPNINRIWAHGVASGATSPNAHGYKKNLTAWRVNLERRQASSYALAKCHSASQVPVGLCAHPHHHVAHIHTHWHFQPPMALSDDRETEGPCLAELLPALSTYCTAPYLTSEKYFISIQSLAVTQSVCYIVTL